MYAFISRMTEKPPHCKFHLEIIQILEEKDLRIATQSSSYPTTTWLTEEKGPPIQVCHCSVQCEVNPRSSLWHQRVFIGGSRRRRMLERIR